MKYFLSLALLFLFVGGITSQDTICIPTLKVEKMVVDIQKKDLLEQKLFFSEQQVRSFIKMDSLYSDLRSDMSVTIISQQESIKSLAATNTAGIKIIDAGFSDLKVELKNIKESYLFKNMWLEDEKRRLENSIKNKNKTITILSSVLAAGLVAAFVF